jgi:hypothetical protein
MVVLCSCEIILPPFSLAFELQSDLVWDNMVRIMKVDGGVRRRCPLVFFSQELGGGFSTSRQYQNPEWNTA